MSAPYPIPINIINLTKKQTRETFLIKIFRAENFIYYITIMIQLCKLQMTKQLLRNFLKYPQRMKICFNKLKTLIKILYERKENIFFLILKMAFISKDCC